MNNTNVSISSFCKRSLRIPILSSALMLASVGVALSQTSTEEATARTTSEALKPKVLKPGEYEWNKDASKTGPFLLVVSLDDQIAYVYRNGVIMARSSVSTGKKGHRTPTGVFSILQKRKKHYSNIYKGAKMPNMQRLTWTGIALHAGNLPGYPASHGCIRLPYDFSELLFEETKKGATVVITKKNARPAKSKTPASLLLKSKVDSNSLPIPERKPFWNLALSPEGPVALLLSTGSKSLYIYRNGILVGQVAIGIAADASISNGVFLMLEGEAKGKNLLVPGQPLRPWSVLSLDQSNASKVNPIDTIRASVNIHLVDAKKIYNLLEPGSLLVVTNELSTEKTRSAPGMIVIDQEQKTKKKTK